MWHTQENWMNIESKLCMSKHSALFVDYLDDDVYGEYTNENMSTWPTSWQQIYTPQSVLYKFMIRMDGIAHFDD